MKRILFFLLAAWAVSACSNKPVNDWIYYRPTVTEPTEPEKFRPYDTLRYETAHGVAREMLGEIKDALGQSQYGLYRIAEGLDETAVEAADRYYDEKSNMTGQEFTLELRKVFSSADMNNPIEKVLKTYHFEK